MLIILVLLGNFIFYIAAWAILGFLAVNLRNKFGFNGIETGLILGLGCFFGTLIGLWTGHLSDKFGRKNLLCGSMALFALFSAGLSCDSYGFIFALSAAGFYIAKSIYDALIRALITDYVSPAYRENAFSARFLSLNLGASIGPWAVVTMGIALKPILYQISAVAFALYALVLFGLLPRQEERKVEKKSLQQLIKISTSDRAFFFLVIVGITYVACLAFNSMIMTQFLYTTAQDDGLKLYAQMAVANCVTICCLQFPVTLLSKNQDPLLITISGFSVIALAFALMLSAEPSSIYVLGAGIIGFGETLVSAKLDRIVDELAPAGMKGLYFGAFTSIQLGMVIGPLLGGVALDVLGHKHLVTPIVGCLVAIGILYVMRCKPMGSLARADHRI